MSLFRRVTEMPWLETGIPEGDTAERAAAFSPAKVALLMFLGVVTSLFFLFVMAYLERMQLADWNPVTEPRGLWINTAFLVLGSVAMQYARQQATKGAASINAPLMLGGLMVLAFLVGQWLAWQALRDTGVYLRTNPAVAFFYLLTAVHGLHLLGGLYVWVRTQWRSLKGASTESIRQSVELCSLYWHYLLLVWLLLFALMLNT